MSGKRGSSEELLNAALTLLSARSRSVEELRGRLLKKGFRATEVARCLVWLRERELLDDGLFSRAYIRDRLRFSPRSPGLLRAELRRRGVGEAVAEEAVDAVLDEEEVTEVALGRVAARGWVRKQSPRALRDLLGPRFSPEREKARRRLYGYLVRRGFRGEAAREGMEAGEEEARKARE